MVALGQCAAPRQAGGVAAEGRAHGEEQPAAQAGPGDGTVVRVSVNSRRRLDRLMRLLGKLGMQPVLSVTASLAMAGPGGDSRRILGKMPHLA